MPTPTDTAKGGFTNRNHFAHFLALGMGPLIWWIQHSLRKRQPGRRDTFAVAHGDNRPVELTAFLALLALGLVFLGCLMSLSRGGAIVMFAAVLISAAVCYRARRLGGMLGLILVAITLLIGAGVYITGYTGLERLDELASGSLETLDKGAGRRTIWAAAVKAIPDFFAIGSGAGSFQEIYPMYVEWQPDSTHYTHCENGPLQVALETGIVGALLLGVGILLCVSWCARGLLTAPDSRTFVCVGAVTASLAVSLLHSAIDFVWYVPACAAIVAILSAAACRLRQFGQAKDGGDACRADLSRPVAVVLALLIVILGGWMVQTRLGPVAAEQHWARYSRLERAAASTIFEAGPAIDEDSLYMSQEPSPPTSQSANEALLDAEEKMADELEQVIRWDPAHATAHLKLSAAYLRLFDLAQQDGVNMMPLSQIREAAIASNFKSGKALDEWLSRAVGRHYRYLYSSLQHARQGLALSALFRVKGICTSGNSVSSTAAGIRTERSTSTRQSRFARRMGRSCFTWDRRPCWPATWKAEWNTGGARTIAGVRTNGR